MERRPLDSFPPVLLDRIGYLLSRIQIAAHAAADSAIGELTPGATVKHQGCLLVIADEGPISQQELSARIGVDRSTMVGIVDDLEERRMVTRTRNPRDRRAYALEVTEAGREWLRQTKRALAESERETFEPLTVAEKADLKRLMIKTLTGSNPD